MQITGHESTESYDQPAQHRIAVRDELAPPSLLASGWFWWGGVGSVAMWTLLVLAIWKMF